MPNDATVLVAGGGVGGLAAALALQRAGLTTTVLERAPERQQQGAGLSIWMSGMLALRRLGAADAVTAAGSVIESQETRTARGTLLSVLPVGPMARAHGLPPPVAIRRGELLRVLRESLDPATVRSAECAGYAEDDCAVTVRLAGGGAVTGAVLVGADGINSVVRRHLQPSVRPQYLGYQSLRAVIRSDARARDGSLVMSCGRGDRFGYTSVGGGAVWWFGVILAAEGADGGPEGRKRELLRRFGGFAAPVPDLIETTRPGEILRHDVHHLAPFERWGAGRVTLLGDAAHAASVAGARGVSLAVEDAVALADCLAGIGDGADRQAVGEALRRYEAARRPAAAEAQAWSAEMGRTLSLRNPVACALRDFRTRRAARRAAAAVDAQLQMIAGQTERRV